MARAERTGAGSASARSWPLRPWLVLGLMLALLTGCASGPAPVYERSMGDVPASGEHRVNRGETLYAIAWRYGLDWKDLADRNGIRAPYTIYPGQRLRLSGRSTTSGAIAGRDAPPSPSSSSATPRTEPAPAPRPAAPPPRASVALDWAWPMQGEVVARFAASGDVNKGIDIRGAAGASVRAAAQGEVVYAGTGLRGWGQLVIVKHDDTWLSAYAHNNEPGVREGQQVERGTVLARVSGGAERARLLHFEIRRQGQPVDPLRLLPRQGG